MNWHRRFTAILILLLLVSAFVAVFHHHADTADDRDCPICLVSHHQYASGQTIAAWDGVPFSLETRCVIFDPVITEKIFTSSRSGRAPPA